MAPTALRAQDTAPASSERTHVVREGDTLWDIARRYLGDPFLWPEVYRLNTDVVEDPHWIYPGESLMLPAGSGVVASGESGPASPVGGTVFSQRGIRGAVGTQRLGVLGRDAVPVVRSGEFYAAPFVVRSEGPSGPGEILREGDVTGIARTSEQSRFQLRDRVFVEPPRGRVAVVGERYLVYRDGPVIPGVGRVVVPTGILQVDRTGPGEVPLAFVNTAFDEVRLGQRVIPLDSFPLSSTARPAPVAGGATVRVVHIPNDPVLPSLLHYVVLDAPSSSGVAIGDEYTLLTGRAEADGKALAPRPVATLRVVRVTDRGATAIVVGQEQPAIREGMVARLTAKMP